MALDTIHAVVPTRQREIGAVVVKHIGGVARWVAGQTSIVLILIPTYAHMGIVRFWVLMAIGTREFGKIGRVGMAVKALVPFVVMRPTVDREILPIVVKSSW